MSKKMFSRREQALGVFLIVVLLGLMAMDRFHQMRLKAAEGSAIGHLGQLKAAVSIWYGDHNGAWPESLAVLVPKYLPEIPPDSKIGSRKSVTIHDGTGGWVYDPATGEVSPNL